MRSETVDCLERVEAALDPAHLARTRQLWIDCRNYRSIPHLPVVVRGPAPDWPQFSMAEIQSDREKMLVSELAPVYASALMRDDRLPGIRANYGTGILPSLFGCKILHLDPATLPAALPLHDEARIREHVARGVPDLRGGLGARVFDTVAFYVEALKPYPKLREWVTIDLADTQGPLDAAEVVWGSEILEMMYAEPELVHAFLDLVTETLAAFTRNHAAIDGVPFDTPPTPLGRVCIREDATVMISGVMYDEFCKPRTQRLLDEFGGCIHWCGDGKAWWRSLITLRRLNAVNPFQGQFYDPVEMHRACRDTGVMVWQWTTGLTPEQRAQIPTGFTLVQGVDSIAAGKRMMEDMRGTVHAGGVDTEPSLDASRKGHSHRSATMHSRERVKRAIHFQGVDHIPHHLPDGQENDIVWVWTPRAPDPQPWTAGADGLERRRDAWGTTWVRPVGWKNHGEKWGLAIPDIARQAAHVLPDQNDPRFFEGAQAAIAANNAAVNPKYCLGVMPFSSLHEGTHNLVGLDNMFIAYYEQPDALKALIARLAEGQRDSIRRLHAIGCDGVMGYDDWGLQDRMMVGMDLINEFFKPHYEANWKLAHDLGMDVWLHSCGYILPLLPHLHAWGLDVIQQDQQENQGLENLDAVVGGKLAFWCPVDVQKTMVDGSVEDIRAYVRRMMATIGNHRGGLCSMAYSQPEAVGHAPEKTAAMCAAFREYGRYAG